jgi:adenylylsulfate kinase
MVIWLIGLSGSGKTTVAKLLLKKIKKKYSNTVHLDGDQLRKIYGEKIGYTIKDRNKNAERLSKLSKFLSDQNINVVASVLSNFPLWQKWNRKNIKNYFQVYLKVSLKTLIKRDKKRLYKMAIKGSKKNVVGVDIKFVEPLNSDLIIENEGNKKSLSKLVNKIIKKTKII